jgi:uncharacterized small protein (DUF1192 family)
MDSGTNTTSRAADVPELDRQIADLRHELSLLEAQQCKSVSTALMACPP